MDATIVKAHQHSAGAKKGEPLNQIRHSRGGNSLEVIIRFEIITYYL